MVLSSSNLTSGFASLDATVARLVSESRSFAKPIFLHTLGVPGSGKSTFVRHLLPCLKDFLPVYVGFDKLMESMPEYQGAQDSEKAFHQYELPARKAGYLLLDRLIDRKASILLDHGGSFSQNIDLLRYARDQQGYTVLVVRVFASAETAKKRIWARQEIEGRHTPLHYVDERFGILNHLLPDYQATADAYLEINNDGEQDPAAVFDEPCQEIVRLWQRLTD